MTVTCSPGEVEPEEKARRGDMGTILPDAEIKREEECNCDCEDATSTRRRAISSFFVWVAPSGPGACAMSQLPAIPPYRKIERNIRMGCYERTYGKLVVGQPRVGTWTRESGMAPERNRLRPKAVRPERERCALFAIRREGAHHTIHPSHAPRVTLLATESKRMLPNPRGIMSQGPAPLKISTRSL